MWDELDEFLEKNLKKFDPKHIRYKAEHYRNVCEVEMDVNGRLNLPTSLLNLAGIDKDVLVKGAGDTLEFWNPAVYENTSLSPEEFAQLGQEIFGDDSIINF